jgi:hypothetical protein
MNCRLVRRSSALCWALIGSLPCIPAAARELEPVTIEVAAGKHLRRDVPVSFEVPAAFAVQERLGLDLVVPGGGSLPVPVQLLRGEPPRLAWILEGEMPPGSTRRYRLRAGGAGSTAAPAVECTDDGRHLLIEVHGRPALRYNHAVVEPPARVEAIFARSGYIHPLWTPAGKVITNDFPLNHKHHHGIWFPWTETVFEGRRVDFWNSAAGLGKVEFAGLKGHGGGPVLGWFRARHRHIDLTAPGGPKTALEELWEVKVYGIRGGFLFDLESTQVCAADSPLLLKEYRYGGLGFRGSGEWEGNDVEFLTSEGRTRKDGHATRARWCAVYGKVGGEPAAVTIFCHPTNFRAPQPMRIHPSEPFFNFAPSQAGDFRIEPGKPYVSRYRFFAGDGEVDAGASERLWHDYAEPPEIAVVRG